MRTVDHWLKDLTIGAGAGLAGTVALQILRAANQRYAPETLPPIRDDPGHYMVEKAEELLPAAVRRKVPGPVETAIGQGLALGYGMTFGALYAALRPSGGRVLSDGIGLGLAAWAAGYLGWLRATGLMPPVREQEPGQVLLPVLQHAGYGVATVAAYEGLRHWSSRRSRVD